MASDGVPVTLPASLVHGSQAPKAASVTAVSGKSLPSGSGSESPEASGLAAERASAKAVSAQTAAQAKSAAQNKTATATNKAELSALVAQLNKYVNDSGRSYQFRVDPQSRNQTIQEINPSSGEVIGEFSIAQFPALARSLGISGVLVDDRA